MEKVLINKFNRSADKGDINFSYLREWLEANNLLTSKMFVCWSKGKIPINAHTGGRAMSNNPTTWSDFDTCLNYLNSHKNVILGIGIMFGLDANSRQLVGIDLDHIDTNNSWDMTEDILSKVKGYKEISQSGTGIHVITFGKLPSGRRKNEKIEMYDKGRFFALTGIRTNQLKQLEAVDDQTEAIKDIHAKYLNSGAPIYSVKKQVVPTKSDLNDEKVLKVMFNSVNGRKLSDLYSGNWNPYYKSQSEADFNFCESLAYYTQKNEPQMERIFRSSGLMRPKWETMRNDMTYGQQTMRRAINSCDFVYDPNYSTRKQNEDFKIQFKKKKEEKKKIIDFDLNDTGNALRFASENSGYIKFNYTMNKWMYWDKNIWRFDMKGAPHIKRLFNEFAERMKKEMFQEEDKDLQKIKRKNVDNLFKNRGKKAVLEEAQCVLDIPTDESKFDVYPELINTTTCIVDLRTGDIASHDKDYMFTQLTKTYPDKKKCPKWEKFLSETFYKDDIPFVKKAVGQTMFGNNKSQKFMLLYGPGSDGKTVFLNIVSKLLGDYAHSIYMNNLTESNFDKDQSRIFAQEGKTRMLIGNEMKMGKKLDVGLLKNIVGGGKIQGRLLYAETFEFEAKFTLWMSSNVKPVINDESDGFWRRCALIKCPFQKKGDKVNPNIENELLEEEGEAIFNWMIEGAMEFAKDERLELTSNMKEELNIYREEMSIMQRFISECAEEVPEAWEPASSLYSEFAKWSRRNGKIEPMSKTAFGKKMSERYNKKRSKYGIVYEGISLKGRYKEVREVI